MTTSFYKAFDQPYRVVLDDKKTWRIYDLRLPEFQSLGPDDEIPDNSPLVKIITEGEFIALIHAAVENGIIENASLIGEVSKEDSSEKISSIESELKKVIEEKQKIELELGYVKEALEEERSHPKVQHSEEFLIKSKALDAIKALAVAEDLKQFNG